MNIVIKAENLSKAYQLGQFSTGTLSLDIERWWASIRGKEDPFLKIGESNDRTQKGGSNIVWSLKDVNFEIEKGSAVGIVGKNGAGKSTLLKLLSKVTGPTSGIIKTKGRVASLLEVGTGFHPELSGRENIFLNGAILGMRKWEIQKKFSEIVEFSGVERYIDTPVKRYSSGMYVRLAFAVAAHLESEILIVDEVLAVGDLEFQTKCLGKMGDISRGEGRTVLFVSHNTNSILNLCSSAILLNNGKIDMIGSSRDVIDLYSKKTSGDSEGKRINDTLIVNQTGKFDLSLQKIVIPHEEQHPSFAIRQESSLAFNLFFNSGNPSNFALRIGLYILNEQEACVLSTITDRDKGSQPITVSPGNFILNVKFANHRLMPGKYKIRVWIKSSSERLLDYTSDYCFIEIDNNFLRGEPSLDMGGTYSPAEFKLTTENIF